MLTKIFIIICVTFISLVLIWFLYTKLHPTFWWKPDDSSFEKIKKSPNFNNKKFENLVKTSVMVKSWENEKNSFSFLSILFPPKDKNPTNPIPNLKLDKSKLTNNTFSWLWHSTILMNLDDLTIITDPVFHRASPVFVWWKPFEFENEITIEDLPEIDIVLISHDHYDHLDYKTIKILWNNVWKYIVPLWVKSHLKKWGIDEEKIIEKYWYENEVINWIDFIFTPSRHFSWRNIHNRNTTLWWGYAINSQNHNIYFTWDTWYFEEFKKIWEKYWPFDIAFIESWAYNKAWPDVHMLPEDSVKVWVDLWAWLLFPIHWAKFDLSIHHWREPINRFIKEAEDKNIQTVTPLIWEVFSIWSHSSENWWEDVF